MTEPPAPRQEAFRRLDERLDALAASTDRTPKGFNDEGDAGIGFRMIGELVGGVLAGLGLGWLLDRMVGTSPLGLIGGMLIGAAGSIYLIARSAGRTSNASEMRADLPVSPAPADEET